MSFRHLISPHSSIPLPSAWFLQHPSRSACNCISPFIFSLGFCRKKAFRGIASSFILLVIAITRPRPARFNPPFHFPFPAFEDCSLSAPPPALFPFFFFGHPLFLFLNLSLFVGFACWNMMGFTDSELGLNESGE